MAETILRGRISSKYPTWIRIEVQRVGDDVYYVAGDLAALQDGEPRLFNASPLGGSLIGLCSDVTLKRWSAREATREEVARMMPLVAKVIP